MGNRKGTDDHFSKRVRTERELREWTQAEMAKMLTAKGIQMHWTTIAKIEKGDRMVRIDEAAGIADLFETSVDVLLGRATPDGAGGLANEIRLARHAATRAQLDIQTSQSSLSETAMALRAAAGWQPEGDAATLMDGCTKAASALGKADRILTEALAVAGGIAK
jgi:transcriptional regulator with XRE-family HTH domain